MAPVSSLSLRQHTPNHRDCPACFMRSALAMHATTWNELAFSIAAKEWLKLRKGKIAQGTFAGYEQYIKKLNCFFGELLLKEINIGHFLEYQEWRQLDHPEHKMRATGASYINHELNTVSQILHHAGLWAAIADHYEPLPLPKKKIGVALEQSDMETLFKVAQTKKRWKVAYLCSLLTANTTAGPGEIRHLQLGDIHLNDPDYPYIHIREGLKNAYRERFIPLNPIAYQAVSELMARAKKLGSHRSDHYLLPARAKKQGELPDPYKPMGSWKKAFYAMRTAANLPKLRRYDFRHHAITVMLENPHISEQTIEDMAGHVSKQMKERYSHIRKTAKKAAAMALFAGNSAAVPKPVAVEINSGRESA